MKHVVLAALVLLVASRAEAQTFRRPFACDTCIANWFYFDHTGETAGTQDWSCATSTYDGHRGTDFSLRGGLAAIDAGHDVVAAADGEVVRAQDGFFDRCTACGGDNCGTAFGFGYGNHVVVDHGDTRVVYAHLRNGSVRVAPGDRVTCGQVLGQIGSSGCSTGAHLHFETRPLGGASTTAFDPFAGTCSPTAPSRWAEQGIHRGIPGATCGTATSCPDGTFALWTCDEAGTARRRCIDGADTTEPCPWGCASMPAGTDDECAPPPDAGLDGATAGDDGGNTLDAGPREMPRISGGCGCRVGARTRASPVTFVLVVATIVRAIRRRRSKPAPQVCD
ncbi:M23 family metallopeptidase [Sandaracinus amylolyticus]|uniref:M23 family metallopeptidase n=1 Tax=Sandaracinus amylolyticus TaxID=927083 RepID=UPI001F2312C2|nr:M23 family metallopeptidase [Sandaracinus amylolyticus]UJR79438.1 Secreted peptidase [Sandaracinus amylolyticus]